MHHGRVPEILVNGVTLHYEEFGIDAPILCLHGTGSSSALWLDAARALGEHGRAIVYDRRGYGRSERPDPFVTDVHEQADDAASLLDVLDAAPAIVVGRSQGGEIAVDLTLRYPDRVRALALLEGGGFALSPAFRGWHAEILGVAEAAAAKDVRGVAAAAFRRILGDAGWDVLPESVREVVVANAPAILAELRGGPLEVRAAELGSISCPTLLVGGTSSRPEFTEVTEAAAAAMPAARVEWVGGGHLIDPAHPAVLGFVDEVLAATS
jgi:pimeloyl-ACP methyl ester carboxylesterase